MELAQARQNLVADQPALRLGVRHIGPELEPSGSTIRLSLLAPHLEQRPHDAVLPAGLDPLRSTAGDEPVQDRLDLIRRGVPRRAQAVSAERIAQLAPLVLGGAAPPVDDLRAQALHAEAGLRL